MEHSYASQEDHVIWSYLPIHGIFQDYENKFFIRQMFWRGKWYKYFYVISVFNDEHLDTIPKGKWVRAIHSYGWYIEAIISFLSIKIWRYFEYVGMLKKWDTYTEIAISQNLDYVLKYPHVSWYSNTFLPENNWPTWDILWPDILDMYMKLLNHDKQITVVCTLWKYYNKSLYDTNIDPEIAYIEFIRVIEIIQKYICIPQKTNIDSLFDTWTDLYKIYTKLEGTDVADIFLKLHGSTRKFPLTIYSIIPKDDIFWNDFDKENIEWSISNLYTLRSMYLHSGIRLSDCIIDDKNINNLYVCSIPAEASTYMKINQTFSIFWLEKITRECLLRIVLLEESKFTDIDISIRHRDTRLLYIW